MGLRKYWGLSHVLLLLLRKSMRGFDCNKFVFVYVYYINQAFHFWTDLNTNWIVSKRGNSWNVIAVNSGRCTNRRQNWAQLYRDNQEKNPVTLHANLLTQLFSEWIQRLRIYYSHPTEFFNQKIAENIKARYITLFSKISV